MKLRKLILALTGATVLLGALVSSASARSFSFSSQTQSILWARMSYAGGIGGAINCEVLLSGTLHSRTMVKSVGSLIGYITSARVLGCERAGMTFKQESLPWHRKYGGFGGTLPNISSTIETATGAEWTIREPGGITCSVVNATVTATNTIVAGAVTRVAVASRARCGGFFEGTLSGTTETVAATLGGARITVTLI